MPLAPSSRRRPSPGVDIEDRVRPSPRQKRRPLRSLVPSLESSALLLSAALRGRLPRRPPLRSSTLAGAVAELPCPFDEVVIPTSPEPRLGPLNFSKELELGRGPLVELPAIEFSIREHEPRFVDTRLSTAGLPFGGRAGGVEGQEPVRLRLPGRVAISAARAVKTTTP
jgi:hypothetical protein